MNYGSSLIDSPVQVMVILKDISEVLSMQRQASDEIYQGAVEANFSHEMNTPLNSILSNCQIILDELIPLNVFRPKKQTRH